MNIDFSKIKLIIWDLDETFWKGILSEGPISPIKENLSLLQTLTDHGIVNSICSKNDYEQTSLKLKELKVDDLFVFKSIDWTPKGQRISKLIKDMGLRPVNCLFLDDNIVNLNEAKFYEKDLMIAEPSIIPDIKAYFANIPVSDSKHKRLKNYQILEQKQQAKAHASDNLEFLYDSDTRVEIKQDCLAHLDRIYELVNRTNQLNFTKLRSTKEEIELICQDKSIQTGYVEVRDKFGEYGIVGFYAVQNNKCIHFLFSCRTIGQGVEQYVYAVLNHPELDIVGEVVNTVTKEPAPQWINQIKEDNSNNKNKKTHNKIILKGACDLKVMSKYLQTDKVIEEFTYTGLKRNNWIEHQNHSVNYLQWHFLSDKIKQELLDECVFNDEEMFKTSIYDDDISIIFLSTMIEPNLGIYRRKKDGLLIAFGEYLYPLTNPDNWDSYIKKEIFDAQNNFTYEWLQDFSERYEFVGNLTPAQILNNVEELLKKTNPNTKICYMLGSETPYEKNLQENYEGRHLIYKEINDLMREYAKTQDRILLIDFNDYIKSQEDFTNNINHFQRRIYYEVATKANEYIGEYTGNKLKQKSRLYLYFKTFADKIALTGFFQTKLWKIIRKPYVYLKKLM